MNQLEKLGEKLAKLQVRAPRLFFTLLIILLITTVPGTLLLLGNVEPSLEKILPQGVDEVKAMNDMRSQFGADMMYILVFAEGPSYDVYDADVLKFIDVLSNRLRENDYILQVTNVADLVKQLNDNVIPESTEEIIEILRNNPQAKMLANEDRTLSVIQIRSDTGATSSVVSQVVNEIEYEISSVEEFNPGVRLEITGFNSIDKATFEVIMLDFAKITGFAFGFMVLFLFFYFKKWQKVLGAISVIMISVLVTLGITGYLGITVTVVTMVAAAMIMALGVSYGINVIYEYYLLRKNNNKKDALIELNKGLIRALVGSSLTTSAGFLALLFGIIPAMKNLGIVLAMGIVVTLIVSIMFLPVIIYRLDKD